MRRKKKNIVLEKVLVEDYAAEGKSLAKVDGKVIFIESVVPGDIVDVQLGRNKKDWAEGWPLRFHSLSTERTIPFCSHFGICGGCQWQMLPYAKQLEYKQKQVRDNLQRIGKVALPEILPIIGAEETKYYRNKIEYTFGTREFTKEKPPQTSRHQDGTSSPKEGLRNTQGQLSEANKTIDDSSLALVSKFSHPPLGESGGSPLGGGAAGFHAKGMFDKIVNIDTCYLQAEPTNAIRIAIREYAKKYDLTFYDIRNHHGFLRTMQVRLCTTGELMVNIVFGEDDKVKREQLLQYVQHQFPSITTLLYTINSKHNDSLYDLEPLVWHGNGYVIEKLEEFMFKIGPKSFFQTNTKQAEQLYRVTRDFAELTGNEIVYDLYCGTGSIGIFASRDAKKIVGVEVIEAAVEDANENAVLNKLEKTVFVSGDVVTVCNDEFFLQHGRPDVIITDPPRAGMHEKLVKKILEIGAPLVVYVSCNPATQARDLSLLDEKYVVTKIQPVDMFPHTLHIENIVQLKLRG